MGDGTFEEVSVSGPNTSAIGPRRDGVDYDDDAAEPPRRNDCATIFHKIATDVHRRACYRVA